MLGARSAEEYRAFRRELWLEDGNGPIAGTRTVDAVRDPAVLQPWLAQLAGHPALMGRALSAVQVERSETDVDAWRFVVASAAPAATTTTTATPAAAPKGSAP